MFHQSEIISSPQRPDPFWVHPASYPKGTGDVFDGSKAPGARRWPQTPSSAQVELYLH
jgi:hypothetical protein